MKPQRKITGSEKKLFLLTGIALVFIVGFGAWWQYVNAIPDVEIPTPKMPSPNAYDFYVKAGKAIIPANPPVDPVHDVRQIPKAQWKTYYPTAKKEAWLRRNAQALHLLRQGFKYPCRVPPQRSFSSTLFGNNGSFRELARMLIVESHAHGERGNWDAATNSALDILRLGHDMARGGVYIDYLVGAALNAYGQRRLWEVLPHLNATESKMAMRRLEKLYRSRVPLADVLREEKYYGQARLVELMNMKGWRALKVNPKNVTGLKSLSELWSGATVSRRTVFDNYSKYLNALIANSKNPYTKTGVTKLPGDIFTELLAPVFERARFSYARDESGDALFLVALALRAYKLEHKTYPQNLRQLVPNYLQKIPADPFGGGEPLRYKRVGRKYSLYSIGPDGIDNRGRAIDNPKFPKAERRRRSLVLSDSKGDVVAGVN
jgi:hypothetical protein